MVRLPSSMRCADRENTRPSRVGASVCSLFPVPPTPVNPVAVPDSPMAMSMHAMSPRVRPDKVSCISKYCTVRLVSLTGPPKSGYESIGTLGTYITITRTLASPSSAHHLAFLDPQAGSASPTWFRL